MPAGRRSRKHSRRQRLREEVSAGGIVMRRPAGSAPLFLVIRDSYRNWGFPKGHLEDGETPEQAALREVTEETGIRELRVVAPVDTIDWHFRFRGRHIHKVCHFFLLETETSDTLPQTEEGITACRWEHFDQAVSLIAYANARGVLQRAHALLTSTP